MKLIDLLVKELPKIGGWPDKVTHIGQDYDRELMFYGRENIRTGIILDCLSIDHRPIDRVGAKVTRAQYESALVASQKPAWDGEALPPVGCECEVKRGIDWVKCKILFISDSHVVLMAAEECCWNTCACQFRPLRTEAEKLRESAIDAMTKRENMGEHWMARVQAIATYEAIAAGKIPGVKLEVK